mgnify:CR=1 FL=1
MMSYRDINMQGLTASLIDMLEGDLARLIGNVVSPDTARDPALERRALEMLKSAVLLPN